MFFFVKQKDHMDCGPTCLNMVANYHGKKQNINFLRENTQISKEGVNLLGIAQAAEKIGFHTKGVRVNFQKLREEAPLPCIVHWSQRHFVVVYKITSKRIGRLKSETVHVADPALGLIKYTRKEFISRWASSKENGEAVGIALLLEPAKEFYKNDSFEEEKGINFSSVFSYLLRYKKLFIQLILGLTAGSLIQLILPFLTQSVVDTGIQTKNLNFIYLVLAAQLMLFVGRLSIDFVRSWILIHISTRVNLSILSDFLIKLLKLPVSYFESKQTGDILQRLNDHKRIESFLTGTSLNTAFSLFNLVVFSVVLAYYNLSIFSAISVCESRF